MNNSYPVILMTGATGFVGKAVAPFFVEKGYRVIAAGRHSADAEGVESLTVSKIDRFTHWQPALAGVDVVVHLAGRAHQMNDSSEESHLYIETNLDGTVNLAQQAAAAGVKKFIFISTTKAMLSDAHEEPLTEDFPCNPLEPYGLSKLKAELELKKISEATGMQVVILRPPLIYGPDVKGNLASLIRLIRRVPYLPLAGLQNRRSLLGVKNLASAIETAMLSAAVNGKTYLVSDGEEISTTQLVERFAKVYNPSCRLFALPAWLWKIAGWLPLLAPKVARLTGSLPVDSSKFARDTGWKAPFSMLEQLK